MRQPSTAPQRSIPPTRARSWLLASAADPETVARADASTADVVIIDLEDGVPDTDKDSARRYIHRRLSDAHPTWVRINDVTTPDWAHDLEMLADAPAPAGIVLAKTESADQVEVTAARLGRNIPIVALIESALGLENARSIAATETLRLAFGSGDFRLDTGTGTDPLALAYARSRLVVASRAENIAGPIDGPTLTDNDTPLRAGLEVGISAGMTGKLCLRPEHTEAINLALAPTHEQMSWAQKVIERLGEDGSGVRNGSERPQLARALRIRSLAHTFLT